MGALAALACLLPLAGGCQSAVPTDGIALFERSPIEQPIPPSELDRAVADLVAAALAGTAEQRGEAFARIEAQHDEHSMKQARTEGRPEMRGLLPLCVDLVNSTLDDPQEYRRASKQALRFFAAKPDPALEARLKQSIADDPLALAGARSRDHWESLWASTFNTVAQPLGNSLIWGLTIAPFNLANSIANYMVGLYVRPDMSLQERQALAHRKRFVAQYPGSVDAPKIRKKIAKKQAEFEEMLSEDFERSAASSLDRGADRLAARQAARALELDPTDERAANLYAEASAKIRHVEDLRRVSEQFTRDAPDELSFGTELRGLGDDPSPRGAPASSIREMLELLLVSATAYETLDPFSADSFDDPAKKELVRSRLERLSTQARLLQDADPNGHLADELEYVLSLTQRDLGFEEQSWERLRELGRQSPLESNMARHAQALLQDPWQNTYGNYQRQRHRASDQATRRRLFGRFANGPPNPGVPTPVAWLVNLPSLSQTLMTMPLRLLFGNWDPIGVDYERTAAIAAYRHIGRNPYGRRSREVASWLYEYELDRENYSGALRLVDLKGEVDATDRVVLMEMAARNRLAAANVAGRRDIRSAMLRGLVRTYPDSDAGFHAGEQLRELVDDASPQRIRMTKSFLEENPEIAGTQGLGMNSQLLDGDLSNGEVHPHGVTFLGGQVIEFALVAQSGDKDDPPFKRRERISGERLSRAVAMLDETVIRNDQLDDGDAMYPDAFRDHYLERARLGLAAEPDMRAAAESDYVYESLREQYGVVRGRDSVLPFDLVFQGSLGDMSLGAFPRWRQPRETPDAFLYK